MPYNCNLFEMSGLRHARGFVENYKKLADYQTVTVLNFPEDYNVE